MFLEKTSSLMRNLRNTSVTVLCIGVKFNATLILLIFHSTNKFAQLFPIFFTFQSPFLKHFLFHRFYSFCHEINLRACHPVHELSVQ